MIKRKIDSFLQEHFTKNRNALLLTGARQTGKTYSIRQYGRSYPGFVEINFIESPDAVDLFREAKNASDILLRLSAYTSVPLRKGETLIFFDEVQACPEMVTAIKFLVDEGSYRYVLSGSLLGVTLNELRSEPVGYLSIKELFPLDFEEFATALGVSNEVISALRQNWEEHTPVDAFVHKKMMEIFRLYLIVGGMPAAVSRYLQTNNLQEVMAMQQDIVKMYRRDIAQHDPAHKLNIREIYDLIPPELNAKNKRFILKRLNEHAKFDRFVDGFLWLTNAGVAHAVYNAEEPKVPLLLARSRNLFKLFANDVGLLAAQYADGIQLRIIRGDQSINYGAIYENAVAQELAANGFSLYYYNNKQRGELDFVVEHNGHILPIEVKSGKDYESHRALSNILSCKEYALTEALVLTNDNLHCEGVILYAPVYMLMFLKKDVAPPSFYKIDLEGLDHH